MPDDYKPSAAEKKLATVLPSPFEPPEVLPYEEREPEKVVPKKGDDGHDTPSGFALAKVGAPDTSDPLSDKERERGVKYLYYKMAKRWGFGDLA